MTPRDPKGGPSDSDDSIATLVRPEHAGYAETQAAGSASEPRVVDPTPASLRELGFDDRYAFRRLLGEGGMGEVRLCYDEHIGREVAIKVIRAGHGSRSDLRARFVREARVQGQLEHPSVVPVYDLGVDANGHSYFTMKRLNGLTLEEILDGLRQGNAAFEATYSRRRLLSALSNVCLAVAFAHFRGVVHRDLKPANIMLGEFGEVYVLDWGVARVAGSADVASSRSGAAASSGTQAGTLLGTPGYMAPEQVRGEIERIDARTDVYALGAILFETLTLQPLHSGTTVGELLDSALRGADAQASERAPQRAIPPELDQICARATATRAADRFQSARQLHDAIERFLDGQRDTERRKELAQRHALDAQVALALATRQGADAEALRRKALRELTTALAFDPTHEAAVTTLMRVLLDPVGELPPEAEAELKEIERRDRVGGVRAASLAFLSWLIALPFVLLLGVKDGTWLALLAVVVLGIVLYTAWMGYTGKVTPRYFVWTLPASCLATALLASFCGPLVLVPVVAVANATAIIVSIRANRTTRIGLTLLSLATVIVPMALQLAGILPASYVVEDGVIKILPIAFEFPPLLTLIVVLGGSMMAIVVGNVLVGRAMEALKSAERSQFAQAWRLRQLLPDLQTRQRAP